MADQAKYIVTLEFQTTGADKEINNLREIQKGIDGAARVKGIDEKASNRLSRTNQNLIDSFDGSATSAKKSEESIISLRYANYDLARSLLAVSAGITAAGVGMAVASASYESAFTSVERTSGVAGQAVGDLRNEFLQLAREIPQTFSELSDLGARGAQLGVATDQLSAFTETVAQFVATSDTVTLDQAVEAFGRISNLMGDTDFSRIGSAITLVGVNAAATEGQIVKTAQELAPFATAVGMSTDEVIGLAAALGSLGQPPERARSAFLTLQRVMDNAIASGSDNLTAFADLLGQSEAQVAQLWKQDPGAFVEAFATSLGSVDDLTTAFANLGINERRAVQVFQALAADSRNAGGGLSVLNRAMADSERGYRENTEMARQFALIQDDLASKWQILQNHLMELVVAGGDLFLPMLKSMIDGFVELTAGVIEFVKSPIGGFVVKLASSIAILVASWAAVRGAIALATATTLAFSFATRGIGGVGVISGLKALITALFGVGVAGKHGAVGVWSLHGALRSLGRLIVVGAVLSYVSEWIFNTGETAYNAGVALGEFANFLLDVGQSINDFFGWGNAASDPTYKAIRSWSQGLKTWGNSLIEQQKNADKTLQGVGNLGLGVADLLDSFDDASAGGDDFSTSLAGVGGAAGEAAQEIRTLVDYSNDLQQVWNRAFDIRFSGSQTLDAIRSSFISIREATEEASKRIRDLKNDIRGLTSDIDIQEYFLSIAVEYGDTKRAEAIEADLLKMRAELSDKTAELQKEQDSASKSLVGNSKGAIENRKTIQDLVKQYQDHIAALASSGMSQAKLAQATQRLKQDFIQQATQLGYNRRELQVYAKAFDDVAVAIAKVPRNITVTANTNPAVQAFNEYNAALNKVRSNVSKGGFTPGFNSNNLKKAARAQALYAEIAVLQHQLDNAKSERAATALADAIKSRKNKLQSENYWTGGFTGPGGKYEPAGIVHRGEYVIPKHDVNQATGMPYADALGRLMGGVPGMASGGATSGSGASSGTSTVALSAGSIQAIAQAVQPMLLVDGQQIGRVTSKAYSEQNTVGAF